MIVFVLIDLIYFYNKLLIYNMIVKLYKLVILIL